MGHKINFAAMHIRQIFSAFLLAGMLTVQAQSTQTINFPDIPVLGYGDASYTLNATASSGLTIRYVSSDASVATVSGNILTVKKTGFTIIKAFQDGNTTFSAAEPAAQLLVITPKATLTVKATDKIIDSGMATPVLTYSITGFKKGETSAVVSGSPVIQSLPAFLSSGTYPIVINKGTLAALNYDFQLVDGILTVNSGTATPVITDKDTLLKIYPNPASDILHISYQDTFDISMLDLQGKEIIKIRDVDQKISIPLSHLKPGMYFVKVYRKSLTGTYKVLINR